MEKRGLAGLLRQTDAHTSVHVAVLLMLILAVIVVGGSSLGQIADASFRQVCAGFVSGSPSQLTPAPDLQEVLAQNSKSGPLLVGLALLTICAVAVCLRLGKSPVASEETPNQAERAESVDHLDRLFQKRQSIYSIFSTHFDQLLGNEVTVDKLMSKNVITVFPSATRREVVEIMHENHIHHVMVNDGPRLVGIISDRDLSGVDDNARAESFMTPNPITTEPVDLLSQAMTQMVTRRISCLPVVSGVELVGALSTTDLILGFQAALRAASEISTALAEA